MPTPTPAARWQEAARRARSHSRRNLLAYSLEDLRQSKLYHLYQRFMRLFRPTFLLTRIVRVLILLLTWVETSAALLFASLLFLLLLPIVGVFFGLFFLCAAQDRRRKFRRLAPCLADKPAVFLFRNTPLTDHYRAWTNELSRDYFVFIVSSDPAAVQGDTAFPLTLTALAPQCYLVREHFYFYLRRRLAGKRCIQLF